MATARELIPCDLQPASIDSPVNGDAFRGLCDHTFWCDAAPRENRALGQGDTVFCKIDEVWRLFRALRRTRKRIVLVTGEGDKPVDERIWAQKPPHISHWFGTNMFVNDPRATPIPLGLGNAEGTATLSWSLITQALKTPASRRRLLYANFSPHSNPSVREPLLRWLRAPDQRWITCDPYDRKGKGGYLENLRTHHFVLCPPGNGEDTHRMWESLYCGAIPVVRKSVAMRNFRDLPILFVEDFSELSKDMLAGQLGSHPTPGCPEKLSPAYWKLLMARAQQEAKDRGPAHVSEWLFAWLSEAIRMARTSRARAF